ncbi:capsule biosynthesis protein (plasmid) [Thioclava sp. 'Guangxiensis']|uniref:capsule biosynthesis protein n=1 Tax=Thioclava sp. 'Guangxiensis' TaxID=3149044 RepID=UPI0032C40DA6
MTTQPRTTKYRIRRHEIQSGAKARSAPLREEPERNMPAQSPAQAPAADTVSGTVTATQRPPAAIQAPPAEPPATKTDPARADTARNSAPRRNAALGMMGQPPKTGPAPDPDDPAAIFEQHDDGFGDMKFADAARMQAEANADQVLDKGEKTLDEEIEAIRRESLTGRQLRLARRMAQKHGIEATSDFEAVLLLRRKGIDPLDRSNILSLVKPDKPENLPAVAGKRSLARTSTMAVATAPHLPAEAMTEEHRASEILAIQRDIARRRRRKLMLLATRLAFFVFLPTLIAAYYYFAMATPTYSTKSEFVIQKADSSAAGSMSSLFSGTQLATNQDSVTVQSFLQSMEAMKRLDEEEGFKKHFQQSFIDPLQRLPTPATDKEAYALYKKVVKIGYDPSEGVIKMEVIAADPETSTRFAKALISYAEEQVDQLTSRLRGDQMQGARDSYDDAEAKVRDAQQKVLELQQKQGVLDPASEGSLVMSQVSAFETQLQQKRLELGQLQDNPSPNAARVAGVQGDIRRLETLIASLRKQLTQNTATTNSIAAVSGDLRIAEADLATRQGLLAQAAQQMETARLEANKQVRYLEMGVRPITPDAPTYPRAFEDTLVAFLIFAGIYLMLSLTASVLREQVSS